MTFQKTQVTQLRRLHEELMRQMTYVTDMEKHKVAEYWEGVKALRPSAEGKAPFQGDCEEFAMLAIDKARKLGFDGRLVTCQDENGDGHCIAEISTADGDESYFFDNRQTHLATRHDLAHYRFYAVSPWNPMPGDQRQWYLVEE